MSSSKINIQSGSSFSLPSEEILEKRKQTIEKFLTIEEQLKNGEEALVQIERGMETKQVLDWFYDANEDLARKIFPGTMRCNGEQENWCNGWMGSRWSDMTLNGRLVRVAFYEKDEDPEVFSQYENWQIKYDNAEARKYKVEKGLNRYLLVVNPYYFDETNDNWPVKKVNPICCLCQKLCENEFGNNPYPLSKEGVCCHLCNEPVIVARIKLSKCFEDIRPEDRIALEKEFPNDQWAVCIKHYDNLNKKSAREAEAALLSAFDAEPKPVKAEKTKKAAKKICRCGNKDCMPRPKAVVMVNGVQRNQLFLQQSWDKKHPSSSSSSSGSGSDGDTK